MAHVVTFVVPIGSMYATIGNIYHQYTPNVSIYTSTMDPMGYMFGVEMQLDISSHVATTF